jgi:co-chaperonin GroES (HSP10)
MTSAKVTPLKNMVMVSENRKAATSEAGIILEKAKSFLTTSGIVRAVGPEVDGISVGDEVYLDWSKGSIVHVDASQYVMVSADHIACVVTGG